MILFNTVKKVLYQRILYL